MSLYHELYVKVKGNVHKNKCVLIEGIHKQKAEKLRKETIVDQLQQWRNAFYATRLGCLQSLRVLDVYNRESSRVEVHPARMRPA